MMTNKYFHFFTPTAGRYLGGELTYSTYSCMDACIVFYYVQCLIFVVCVLCLSVGAYRPTGITGGLKQGYGALGYGGKTNAD